MDNNSNLIPYFVPSLAATLINAEDLKGSPLEYEEAISIRDNAPCIMITLDDAREMDEKRGYIDVDPENLWYSWQMLRKEMERKPDIDPGPSFVQINNNNDEYQRTIDDARKSIQDFRAMLPQDGSSLFEAMVKLKMSDGDNTAYIWLANTKLSDDGFVAEIFEVPKFFPNFTEGQSFNVTFDEIFDWMVNVGGILYGGFSLRYQRSKLSEKEKKAFDEHIGVTKYA